MIRNIFPINNERGFTLIEIIIAMVLIGIAVPTIMIPFSGLSDTKNPEYIIQASFEAQRKMEQLASEYRDSSGLVAACPDGSNQDVSFGGSDYKLICTSTDVDADDPDTSATATFAKKITLTVSRSDGAMSSLEFNHLFARDE